MNRRGNEPRRSKECTLNQIRSARFLARHQRPPASFMGAVSCNSGVPKMPLLRAWQAMTSRRKLEALILFSLDTSLNIKEGVCWPSYKVRLAFAETCTLSNKLVDEVEKLTCGQSSNQLWFDLHNGRITRSTFGEVHRRRCSTSGSAWGTAWFHNRWATNHPCQSPPPPPPFVGVS